MLDETCVDAPLPPSDGGTTTQHPPPLEEKRLDAQATPPHATNAIEDPSLAHEVAKIPPTDVDAPPPSSSVDVPCAHETR